MLKIQGEQLLPLAPPLRTPMTETENNIPYRADETFEKPCRAKFSQSKVDRQNGQIIIG